MSHLKYHLLWKIDFTVLFGIYIYISMQFLKSQDSGVYNTNAT